MRKDLPILLLILIPAAVLMFFASGNATSFKVNNPFAATTPFPTISSGSSQIASQNSIPPVASKNIEVLNPFMGDAVKSGFVVKGNARTFESNVNIRLSDSSGNILIETVTTANAPDVGSYGPFEKQLDFITEEIEGKLEVFQYSAKDGEEIDKVEIPLIFTK